MPGSGDFDSAQGSTVSFGSALAKLISFVVTPGQASTTDITSLDSTIVGSGDDSRIFREVDCLAVDSGSASVRMFGAPPFLEEDVGSKDTLTVTFPGGSFSGEAILVSFEVEGEVGELMRGSAQFQFTGASGS